MTGLKRTLNEVDDLAGAAADLAEGVDSTRQSGTGGAGGAAQALSGLGRVLTGLSGSILCGLGGLLGGGRLKASGDAGRESASGGPHERAGEGGRHLGPGGWVLWKRERRSTD